MTSSPLKSHNCRLRVAPKTESSESSSGNTRSNRLSAPWLSDSFTRHGDRIEPLVPTVLSKQDWRASFFRLTSRRQVTIIQSNDCQCPLRGWLPDVTVTHCTSGHASRTPRSVRLMKRQMFQSLLLRRSCRDRMGTHCRYLSRFLLNFFATLLLALASHSPAPSAKGHRRPSFGLTGLDPAG